MYALLLRGGAVIDGTGAPARVADVAVDEGKIVAVGQVDPSLARQILPCDGSVITPGFIDIHRHGDGAAFRGDYGALELSQGLTSVVNGNCGLSAAPCSGPYTDAICAYLSPITGTLPQPFPRESMASYLTSLPPAPIHTGMLVGGGTLRADVAGYGLARLEDIHYRAIHNRLECALGDGALGVSLGLGYAPECFYTTQELIRALAPLQDTDIPLTVHMRQEGTGVCDSIREMLTVAKALRCPLHISHLKAMGRGNWGLKIPRALALLTSARQEGLDVTCDVYPYTAGSTQLLHILPPDFLEGGLDVTVHRLQNPAAREALRKRIESGEGFDNIAALAGWDGIFLTSLRRTENACYLGKNLAEIGAMRNTSPLDACCDLLISEHGRITMIDFMASEEDILSILRCPFSNVISDATYPTEGQPHPRVYGTFARLIEHFVVERGVLSLEEAICKVTGQPASVLHLAHKGRIALGFDADLCVFSPEEIHERGTYTDPCRRAEGMRYVLVNGAVALDHGCVTDVKNGTVLRRSHSC